MSDCFLTLITPGLATLVVDQGRPATRSLGVPVGGAADRRALAIGNGLVGNSPDAAALEITLAGPTLVSNVDLAGVVYGAPFDLSSARQHLVMGRTFTLHAGEELHLGGATDGVRAYLCVRGGLLTPVILGSRTSFALKAGDRLPCFPGTIRPRSLPLESDRNSRPSCLRTLEGAQADWFQVAEFFGQEFTVTPSSNRMGLRLAGRPLQLPQRELVSEPVCPGAVQVTRDGQCIVLGVDGQTIGGYPKIAQVISADIDKLAQLRPGAKVQFAAIALEEAESLYIARQAELREWLTRLRTTEALP